VRAYVCSIAFASRLRRSLRDRQLKQSSSAISDFPEPARDRIRGQQERETLGEDGSRRFRQRSPLDRQVYLRRPHEGAMEISLHRSSYFLFPRNRCANAFIGTDFFSLAPSRVADITRSISRQQLQQRFNDFNRSVERTRMRSGILSDTSRTIDRRTCSALLSNPVVARVARTLSS